jgi:hypothetical protein
MNNASKTQNGALEARRLFLDLAPLARPAKRSRAVE